MKRMKPKEVFEYLAEEWQWITIDSNGDAYIHQEEPEKTKHGWDSDHQEWCPITIDFAWSWEESLFERPKKIVMASVKDSVIILYTDPVPYIVTHSSLAPPEVAEWFHRVMEQSK